MNKSETTTFYNLLEKAAIEIPMLQRDYAQGRDDPKTKELRKQFIRDLITATPDKPAHLDFIYGPEHDGTFQPLDGQQRLTTLFLLHWYLAVKADKLELKEVKETLKKFRYKVRVSTQEFITALLIPDNVKDEELSKKNLKDAKWYFSSWDYDPSIQGMLNMIDTIHTTITERNIDCSNLWKTLTGEDAPITFTVLNMEKFGLGDELYMRMNARGLPLTDFENFKAWLHDHCEEKQFDKNDYFHKRGTETQKEEQKKCEKNWPYKLDKEWTNLIWNSLTSEEKEDGVIFDERFMRLFNGFAACAIANENPKEPKDGSDTDQEEAEVIRKDQKAVIEDIIAGNPILTSRYPASAFSKEALIRTFSFLDLICANNWVAEFTVGFEGKELYSYKKLLKKQGVEDRRKTLIITYALVCFKETLPDQFLKESQLLKRWTRVIRNLVENTTINTEQLFINAIQAVDSLLKATQEHNGDIITTLAALPDFGIKDHPVDLRTFTEPIKEEQMKARVINSNSEWERVIVDAETHPLFRGQIAFLLQGTNKADEINPISSTDYQTFNRHWKNAKKYFNGNGVAAPFDKDALLMRAYISRMNQWGQLWNIPFGNGTYTWREVILKVKEGKSEKLVPLLPLLDIESDNPAEQMKQWLSENSKLTDSIEKRVHQDLYKMALLFHAEDQSYLKLWNDGKGSSRFIYYLMPYNAKADWKKVVIGIKRNEVLAELIKSGQVTSNDQLARELPFFRCSSATFQYNKKSYRWDRHNQIYFKGREEPLILEEQGVTEKMLTGKKIMELLDGFAPSQQI